MNILLSKFKEVISAVVPVVVFVVILHFTFAPLSAALMFRFILGALFIILGMTILLIGVDLGILPFGDHMATAFVKSNKLLFVIVVGFILGFLINFAEPDLQVLAAQVAGVTDGAIPRDLIRLVVALGTGTMLFIGITRIVKQFRLNMIFIAAYGFALLMALFASSDMFAIAFDASGAATGAVTVPLVLALSVGMSSMKRDSLAGEEDSFGLVGVMASGAVVGVLLLNMFFRTDGIDAAADFGAVDMYSRIGPFINEIWPVLEKTIFGLTPVVVMFVIFQKIKFKLRKKQFIRVLIGFLYTFIGLILFFLGVYAGFLDVGTYVGQSLAEYENPAVLVGFGFVMGLLVVLTEPAVHVLTHQIEDVTSGSIKRITVLITLAVGVAIAVALAMVRLVAEDLMLWHFLVPGYAIALILSFFVPKIFVGIAFDSGGVASGPMTATFGLAFAQGAASVTAKDPAGMLADSFGVIAMVAMTPIVALQILGLIYHIKSRKSEV